MLIAITFSWGYHLFSFQEMEYRSLGGRGARKVPNWTGDNLPLSHWYLIEWTQIRPQTGVLVNHLLCSSELMFGLCKRLWETEQLCVLELLIRVNNITYSWFLKAVTQNMWVGVVKTPNFPQDFNFHLFWTFLTLQRLLWCFSILLSHSRPAATFALLVVILLF